MKHLRRQMRGLFICHGNVPMANHACTSTQGTKGNSNKNDIHSTYKMIKPVRVHCIKFGSEDVVLSFLVVKVTYSWTMLSLSQDLEFYCSWTSTSLHQLETNDFLWQKSPPGLFFIGIFDFPFLRVEFVFTISIVCHSSPTNILKWRSSDIILRPEVRSKLIQQIHQEWVCLKKLAPCFNPTNLSSHQNLQIFTTSTSKKSNQKTNGIFWLGKKKKPSNKVAFLATFGRSFWKGLKGLPWVEGWLRLRVGDDLTDLWNGKS